MLRVRLTEALASALVFLTKWVGIGTIEQERREETQRPAHDTNVDPTDTYGATIDRAVPARLASDSTILLRRGEEVEVKTIAWGRLERHPYFESNN
jgi:hypothetical protein